MATYSWGSEVVSLTSYLTTELNSLANDTLELGAEINNETNRALYMDIEIHLASVDMSAQTGLAIDVYLVESIDGGTTYGDGTDGSSTAALLPAPSSLLSTIGIRAGSGAEAHNAVASILPIPPGRFKLGIRNSTGAAWAASGNTVKYRTYGMASA